MRCDHSLSRMTHLLLEQSSRTWNIFFAQKKKYREHRAAVRDAVKSNVGVYRLKQAVSPC